MRRASCDSRRYEKIFRCASRRGASTIPRAAIISIQTAGSVQPVRGDVTHKLVNEQTETLPRVSRPLVRLRKGPAKRTSAVGMNHPVTTCGFVLPPLTTRTQGAEASMVPGVQRPEGTGVACENARRQRVRARQTPQGRSDVAARGDPVPRSHRDYVAASLSNRGSHGAIRRRVAATVDGVVEGLTEPMIF